MSRFNIPIRNGVAQFLIEQYGLIFAKLIADANIRLGDGAPGYWEDIRDAIDAAAALADDWKRDDETVRVAAECDDLESDILY